MQSEGTFQAALFECSSRAIFFASRPRTEEIPSGDAALERVLQGVCREAVQGSSGSTLEDYELVQRFFKSNEAPLALRAFLTRRTSDGPGSLAPIIAALEGMRRPAAAAHSANLAAKIFERVREGVTNSALSSSVALLSTAGETPPEIVLRTVGTVAKTGSQWFGDVKNFTSILRRQIRERYLYLAPPVFDQPSRLPLQDLYIPPHLVMKEVAFPYEFFLEFPKRALLIAGPGGGKSTLVHKLALQTADLGDEPPYTLLPIAAREFVERGRVLKGLAESIHAYVATTYMLVPPRDALHYLMTTGRLALAVDGLDELASVDSRLMIARELEALGRAFPCMRIIVTTRPISYLQAPLSSDLFVPIHLEPFDQAQVRAYASRWFYLNYEVSQHRKRGQVHNRPAADLDLFLEQASALKDAAANPLLLSLLCSVFSARRPLPQNRVELYEHFADLFLNRWDTTRGIKSSSYEVMLLQEALEDLALQMVVEPDLEAGIPDRALRAHLTGYLAGRLGDERIAAGTANEWIDVARGRTWILADVGTSSGGRPLYGFAHRSLLEYFAAKGLCRQNPSGRRLWNAIRDRIAQGEWTTILELALAILSRGQQLAADEFIDELLNDVPHFGVEKRARVLSFAVEALTDVDFSPGVARKIIRASLEDALTRESPVKNWTSAMRVLVRELSAADQEAAQEIVVELRALARGSAVTSHEVQILWVAVLNLDLFASATGDAEGAAFWDRASRQIARSLDVPDAPVLDLALALTRKGGRSPGWLTACYGAQALFVPLARPANEPGVRAPSAAQVLLGEALGGRRFQPAERTHSQHIWTRVSSGQADIGALWADVPAIIPSVELDAEVAMIVGLISAAIMLQDGEFRTIAPGLLSTVSVLLAITLEYAQKRFGQGAIPSELARHPQLGFLTDRDLGRRYTAELAALRLDVRAKSLLQAWLFGRVSFVTQGQRVATSQMRDDK